MNPDFTVSLFFGFMAKEILLGAMAVIDGTTESGLGGAIQSAITPLQSLSFMTFVLRYNPLPRNSGRPDPGVEESQLRAAFSWLVVGAGLGAGLCCLPGCWADPVSALSRAT